MIFPTRIKVRNNKKIRRIYTYVDNMNYSHSFIFINLFNIKRVCTYYTSSVETLLEELKSSGWRIIRNKKDETLEELYRKIYKFSN